MQDIPSPPLITANGEYNIYEGPGGASVVVEIDGGLGGGTVTLGRSSIDGNFAAYKDSAGADITMVAGDMQPVIVGVRGKLALKVLGATTPTIKFKVERARPNFYR